MQYTKPKVNIQDYIDLYNKGYKIGDIKPIEDQTYKVFLNSKMDIRVIDRQLLYQNPLAFQRIGYFVAKNEFFYMVPIYTIEETIVGFILRGVFRKEYSSVSRDFIDDKSKVPLMFGFNKHFAKLDSYSKCYPIVVCEGCKDCMVLKKYYPYVLANNTSSMGINAEILSNVSNKFLLAYDNDEAGRNGMKNDKRVLRNKGLIVDSLDIKDGFKDCADHISNPKELKALIERMKIKLEKLYRI